MENTELQRILGKSFRSACRVLFGRELGGMDEFEPFLSRYADPVKSARSFISKKKVYFTSPYSKDAAFIALEEQGKLREITISINDIKDIDSLFDAAGEIAVYCGSKSFGNSQQNAEFDSIFDSSFIYKSHDVMRSEYVAYTNLTINSKHLFGCSSNGESTFLLNVSETFRAHRSFESGMLINASDVFYSYYLKNCQNCLFCFNQISKRRCIGNNELPKEKFDSLKGSLVSQIADELKTKKSVPSLVELVGGGLQ